MKIWAHRGCSQMYPENTLTAFEKLDWRTVILLLMMLKLEWVIKYHFGYLAFCIDCLSNTNNCSSVKRGDKIEYIQNFLTKMTQY